MLNKHNVFGMSMTKSIDNALPPIVFVHGFLGQPEDWKHIQNHLRTQQSNPFVSVNLWDLVEQDCSLEQMAQKLEAFCPPGSAVVGYSLGGRILMHLRFEILRQLGAMIFISSHIGLATELEKQKRLESDKAWALRFLDEPWDALIRSWDQQSIFEADVSRPYRLEKDYDRIKLAKVLQGCSLGLQSVELSQLSVVKNSVYGVGEKDKTYRQHLNILQSKNIFKQLVVIEGMGHYGLQSQAEQIAQILGNVVS